jgi:hypothetical protein
MPALLTTLVLCVFSSSESGDTFLPPFYRTHPLYRKHLLFQAAPQAGRDLWTCPVNPHLMPTSAGVTFIYLVMAVARSRPLDLSREPTLDVHLV